MKYLAASIALVFGSVTGALGAEGRIPIFQPATLVVSGSYILTNDIVSSSGPAIKIGANDVTIDLNGHTVTGDVGILTCCGEHRVTIGNGRIVGELTDVPAPPSAVLSASWVDRVRLRQVTGLGGGVYLDPCWSLDMDDVKLDGNVQVNGNTSSVSAHVVNSRIHGTLGFGSLQSAEIRGNSIGGDLTFGKGDMDGNGDNLIENNSVAGHIKLFPSFAPASERNVIRGNIASGLEINSNANEVQNNSVRNGTIAVGGSLNVLDGNTVQGGGYGISLTGNNNVYRNNVLHNNASGAVQDLGTGNLDAGGNVN